MTTPIPIQPLRNKQRGAALIIMGLILVLGLITLFTFNLERKSPELEAERKTALALAQAKEALLGRAASNNDPGSLPCPSVNGLQGTSITITKGPGTVECGNSIAKSNFGWLPWSTLAIGDVRDGSATLLWYMLSSGYVDQGTYSPPPNAPTLNVTIITVDVNPDDLSETIIGAPVTHTNIAAVVLAPGAPFQGQDRAGTALTDSSKASVYFEGTSDSINNALTIKIERKQNRAPLKYNDQHLLISVNDILARSAPNVAQIFATALSDYYVLNGNTYPPNGWVPSDSEWTNSSGTYTQWVTPVTQVHFTKTSNSTGELVIDACPAIFNIQQVGGGARVTRAGNC